MTNEAKAGSPGTSSTFTVDDASAIAAIADPTLRNLRITLGYHDLELALARRICGANVTWCAYATWASKTAGGFIRGDEVPTLVRALLADADEVNAAIARANEALAKIHVHAIVDAGFVTRAIHAVLDDVSSNIAEGNLRVFAELAPVYATFLATFAEAPAAADPRAIDAFVAKVLRPGDVQHDGQDLLILAFRTYYAAMFERDAAAKAQALFYANALVGYHEQVRLQGPIASSLDAPIVDTIVAAAKDVANAKVPTFLHRAVEAVVDEIVRPIAEQIERAWQRVSTRWLMRLALPKLRLDLGEDVPPWTAERMFPAGLEVATQPPLVDLLAKLDRTPNTVHGSAATDWTSLGDRMNYIVDLFRSRQQDRTLCDAPFDATQIVGIRAGTIPDGPL